MKIKMMDMIPTSALSASIALGAHRRPAAPHKCQRGTTIPDYKKRDWGPLRTGNSRTHKKEIMRRRLDRSVVFLDLYPAVDPFDALGLARDGDRLVGRFLGACSSNQPHHAIDIGIDVYIPQARDVFGSKLRLYLGGDRRILDERLRMRTIRVCEIRYVVANVLIQADKLLESTET
jgi:hypothetical protein